MSADELLKVLGLTIKRDEENKLITFLCELSAYTESDQLNVSFNAPSSTGKSYIPMEIAQLFPEEDVIELGYCSPTAFFHDRAQERGNKDKKDELIVDLSNKVIIFLDQPHTLLLQHLRPMLSHDRKEIKVKITDKTQKIGMRAKNIVLRGYPAVIFCSAGTKIDEQETTRFILLSPETSREKIREAIHEKIMKETDKVAYLAFLEKQPGRQLLKERIRAIKNERITEIRICPVDADKIEAEFFKKWSASKPRHQRDIGRILSIIKQFALLNLWHRERDGSTIIANEEDIREAFKVWGAISESQDLNLPPYLYHLYRDIFVPLWNEKNPGRGESTDTLEIAGVTRQEVMKRHRKAYMTDLPEWKLRQDIIPALEAAGLVYQEPPLQGDKRRLLIYLVNPGVADANNSELSGGVDIEIGSLLPLQ